MSSKAAIAFAILACVALSANAALDRATALGYADLDASKSVPPINSPAKATFLLASPDSDGNFDYELKVENILGMSMAHVHAGDAKTNGPVLVTLIPIEGEPAVEEGGLMQLATPVTGNENFAASFGPADLMGAAKSKTAEEFVTYLKENPTYVNIHTKEYPDGVIRGQIEVTQ